MTNQHIELIARAEEWLDNYLKSGSLLAVADLIRELKHALEETLTKEK